MKTQVLLANLLVLAFVAVPQAMAQEFAAAYNTDYSHDAADEMAMKSAQYASQFCSANVCPPQMQAQPYYDPAQMQQQIPPQIQQQMQLQMQQPQPAQAFEMSATANGFNNQNQCQPQQGQNNLQMSDWQTQVPAESMNSACANNQISTQVSPDQQAMFQETLDAASRRAYHSGGNKKFRGAMSSMGSAVNSAMKQGMGVALPTGTAIGTYFIMKAAFGPLANPYMMTLPMTQALMMRALMH